MIPSNYKCFSLLSVLIRQTMADEACCGGAAKETIEEAEPLLSTLDIIVLGLAGKIFFLLSNRR